MDGLPSRTMPSSRSATGACITNEEFDDTLAEVSLKRRAVVWRYGHSGIPGSSAGYLDAPDDAYRIANGITTVADIKNCRIVQLRHNGSVLRVLGGICIHDPPRGFASPNGDTPLPDGGLLITEIGGWIDRLDRAGRLVWSVRSPVSYPSDAQLLPNGHILVCSFTTPGRVVELTRDGKVVWSFGATSGPNRLDRPSLAIRLPNGLVAINDDWRHRVILVDPRSNRIVWQYGHTDVPSNAPGYLNKPDGMDFLPAAATTGTNRARAAGHAGRAVPSHVAVAPNRHAPRADLARRRRGVCPATAGDPGRACPRDIFERGPRRTPSKPRNALAAFPPATHDAAAVRRPRTHRALRWRHGCLRPRRLPDRPRLRGSRAACTLSTSRSPTSAPCPSPSVYLVGGYTGTRFATAILRVLPRQPDRRRGPAAGRRAVCRCPVVRRAIYVAGGVTPSGPSAAVYRVDVGRAVSGSARFRPTAHAPLSPRAGLLWLIGGDRIPRRAAHRSPHGLREGCRAFSPSARRTRVPPAPDGRIARRRR